MPASADSDGNLYASCVGDQSHFDDRDIDIAKGQQASLGTDDDGRGARGPQSSLPAPAKPATPILRPDMRADSLVVVSLIAIPILQFSRQSRSGDAGFVVMKP